MGKGRKKRGKGNNKGGSNNRRSGFKAPKVAKTGIRGFIPMTNCSCINHDAIEATNQKLYDLLMSKPTYVKDNMVGNAMRLQIPSAFYGRHKQHMHHFKAYLKRRRVLFVVEPRRRRG